MDEILAQLEKLESLKGTFTVPDQKSPVSDQLKFKLCQQILKFKMKRDLTNNEMANLLGVNATRVSEICRCQYHLYTVDRLIDLIQILSSEDKDLKAKLEKGLTAFT